MKNVYYLQDENGFKYTAAIYTNRKTAQEAATRMIQYRNDGVAIEVKKAYLTRANNMKIEITSNTFGRYTINGIERVLMPGDRCRLDIREGQILQIEINAKDPFQEERLEYFNRQQTLFGNDT